MIEMTRRVTFSAAHADWLPQRSAEENRRIFGAKASPEPYGHNYVLDVGVAGAIDPRTGILVNIKEIDRIVREEVVCALDRKFLNRQVAHFRDQPVTAENLIRFIVPRIAVALPGGVGLCSVRLEPEPIRWATWRGSYPDTFRDITTMMVTHVYEFAASHRLHSAHLTDEENRQLFGKCNYENGHGHNYVLEVTVAGPVDARSGRVIDGDVLDAIVNAEIVERYDHRHLNFDVPDFAGQVPSAEVITRVIFDRLKDRIPAPARLHRVLVRETARNFFEYQGEDRLSQ
ncbi:MAG: 6-carboxytetrahydropterin synthase [Chloroherpetonaceae bacterium]|nr:6-carboxytetrahydropterin synthase [Chthonomonadaceae bacterium]MDW8206809.1 6-carboxytetrahydropterin synthase [Chloroherpetonaceae bacterium]